MPEGTGTDRSAGTGTEGCEKRGLIRKAAKAVRDSSDAHPCLQQGIST